jgi:hypothetical protein
MLNFFIIILIIVGIVLLASLYQSKYEGFVSPYVTVPESTEWVDSVDSIDSLAPNEHVIGNDYVLQSTYPRYKQWYRWIHNIKTRPEYDRIYQPHWNMSWDPGLTTDMYMQRLASENIIIN